MSSSGSLYVFPPHHEKRLKERGYSITETINSGKYGRVCHSTRTVNGKSTHIAVKIIDLTKTSDNYRNKMLPKELQSIETLKHPFIIEVYDIIIITNTVYMFMERGEGGDLYNALMTDPNFTNGIPEPRARKLYAGLASALQFMHSKGWAHRDIKCENMLLNKDKSVAKLADFGLSTSCFNSQTGERQLKDTFCGSPAYTSPEVHRQQPYDAFKSDVWAMGVVLYMMVNKSWPFSQKSIDQWSTSGTNKIGLNFRNKSASDSYKDLVTKQLTVDQTKRLTMTDVLRHSWLQQQ